MVKVELFSEFPNSREEKQALMEELYKAKGIDLNELLLRAHAQTLEEAEKRSLEGKGRGYMASTMSWNIRGELYKTYPELMQMDQHKRDYLMLGKNIRIYFKKLDNKYRPSNIVTKHVISLNTQQLLFRPSPITVLYAGFRLAARNSWDELEGCYLVEMKNLSRTFWISDLSMITAETAVPTRNVIIPELEPNNDLDVRIRKDVEKQTGEGETKVS
ncbi:hypothetical protein [Chitinophaga barathri]|uniref:Uncharacterized protein n=1 Tax=Chitinophaga barathri TaxID=1647451 RepID=A0A3N4MIG3_9BACT|nr:hypothetical protein [Chitinophaga barathri]RPD39449.1 hypothetical protein EG028_20220 [Chitinophaga barathri]